MSKNRPRKNNDSRKIAQRGQSPLRIALLDFLTSKSTRETIESIVVAFTLAFLFRTFEAEAFVIPTGSMAPTLQGRHQDIDCPMCGYAYRVSASQEGAAEDNFVSNFVRHITGLVSGEKSPEKLPKVIGGECLNCRYWACTDREAGAALGRPSPFNRGALEVDSESSSASGDRIIVSKFAYQLHEPERWDVFVFRFPGDGSRNYIKRLVGLPGETLKLHRGDAFVSSVVAPDQSAAGELDYTIARKPPFKAVAMAQLVHDNSDQSDILARNGWPHRWDTWPRNAPQAPGGWSTDDHRRFVASGSDSTVWLRYQHRVADFDQWNQVMATAENDNAQKKLSSRGLNPKPRLISDAYSYNSGVVLTSPRMAEANRMAMGLYWVGDLMLECKLEAKSSGGLVVLELVEGGKYFQCELDLATGEARLGIDGEFYDQHGEETARPKAKTNVRGAGTYDLRFANFDDQLFLWVDGESIEFDRPTTYPPLGNTTPISDAEDGGDLAPVGIGVRGAEVAVDGLKILRDVYYISIPPDLSWVRSYFRGPLAADLRLSQKEVVGAADKLLTDKNEWSEGFSEMHALYFPLRKFDDASKGNDQFFALGDNSPQSKDSRLWETRNTGYYVERDLLIGKALFVYWPLDHIQLVR
ncbi:MAG: signal peptidase I [Planctomycetota bacterium]|nr:signal peptidase I [Planctomycetota bacterium]